VCLTLVGREKEKEKEETCCNGKKRRLSKKKGRRGKRACMQRMYVCAVCVCGCVGG
jgi:hypothetical protein